MVSFFLFHAAFSRSLDAGCCWQIGLLEHAPGSLVQGPLCVIVLSEALSLVLAFVCCASAGMRLKLLHMPPAWRYHSGSA